MSVRSTWSIFLVVCVVLASLTTGCSSDDASENAQVADTESTRGTIDSRARAFLLQGEKAFQGGAYQRALALADSAETYEPDVAVIPFFRGSVYTALKQIGAAQDAYQKAIALDPEYPEARLRMGDNEFDRGNLREALRMYREEEKVARTSPLYVKMGRTHAELGEADSARRAYEAALALDSTNANAHLQFGQFLEETGDLEAALTHSRRALKLQPENPNHRFTVGSQLFRSGQLEEAAGHLKRAADARLLHYPAQYNLGQVLTRLGRTDEASYYLARADSARQLMDRITSTQEAASRNPTSVEAWIRLGELYRTADERGKAFEAFNRALILQPNDLTVHSHLAEMLLAEGKTKEAIQRFEAILNADGTRVDTWLNLGLAQAVSGNCEEARRAWKTALERRPGNATAKEYLSGLCQYTAR